MDDDDTENGAVPFGRNFFGAVFADRVRRVCVRADQDVTVVALLLADGETLDLCHIAELTPRWMLAAAYRSDRMCDAMDFVFVPYETILRVTVSSARAEERKMGFSFSNQSQC